METPATQTARIAASFRYQYRQTPKTELCQPVKHSIALLGARSQRKNAILSLLLGLPVPNETETPPSRAETPGLSSGISVGSSTYWESPGPTIVEYHTGELRCLDVSCAESETDPSPLSRLLADLQLSRMAAVLFLFDGRPTTSELDLMRMLNERGVPVAGVISDKHKTRRRDLKRAGGSLPPPQIFRIAESTTAAFVSDDETITAEETALLDWIMSECGLQGFQTPVSARQTRAPVSFHLPPADSSTATPSTATSLSGDAVSRPVRASKHAPLGRPTRPKSTSDLSTDKHPRGAKSMFKSSTQVSIPDMVAPEEPCSPPAENNVIRSEDELIRKIKRCKESSRQPPRQSRATLFPAGPLSSPRNVNSRLLRQTLPACFREFLPDHTDETCPQPTGSKIQPSFRKTSTSQSSIGSSCVFEADNLAEQVAWQQQANAAALARARHNRRHKQTSQLRPSASTPHPTIPASEEPCENASGRRSSGLRFGLRSGIDRLLLRRHR